MCDRVCTCVCVCVFVFECVVSCVVKSYCVVGSYCVVINVRHCCDLCCNNVTVVTSQLIVFLLPFYSPSRSSSTVAGK